MENPRPEKVAVVDEVRAKLEESSAAVLTEYRGLDVASTAELRRALTNAGGEYKVYKNTLVRIAARDLGLELDDLLTGPTAIAFVTGDAVSVAKALQDFAKTNPALVVKGGLLGEQVIDESGVKALADLEPREVLLAKFAGLLAAPLQQMANLLEALPRNFAYGLKALIDQGGAPGAPADAPAAAEDEAPAADAEVEAPAPEAEADAPAEDTPAEAPAAAADTDTDQAEESADTEKES
ncbi:MAG TPA: 50S ribosomal protein L10 [Aquihabitans sp.]|nr:50S ribosomal protein L10 [Aquihabitans sp.]